MQAPCDKAVIVSPALKRIFANHYMKKYHLSWFKPFINRWKGRKTIAREIAKRFETVANQNDHYFNRTGQKRLINGNDKLRNGAKLFIEDFLKLSHYEVYLLYSMNMIESLGEKEADTYRIKTIDKKPIIFKEVK